MNHTLLAKFKQKARAVEPIHNSHLDFPFTNLQMAELSRDERRDAFLNNILLTAEQMASKIFDGVDEKLILFFAAYLFVYQQPRSNFRLPEFYEIDILDQDVPDEIHQIVNPNIKFGLYETAKNVKSNAAFFFCYKFAKDLIGSQYNLKKSDFKAEDLLAKIGAPFLIDDVETCKKFCIFDGRRPANQARLFLFDVSAGHIEALKIKNPIGTSYEYDENFMAYGRKRGTFENPTVNGQNVHFSRKSGDSEFQGDLEHHHFDTRDIDTDSEHILEKLAACERFCFI